MLDDDFFCLLLFLIPIRLYSTYPRRSCLIVWSFSFPLSPYQTVFHVWCFSYILRATIKLAVVLRLFSAVVNESAIRNTLRHFFQKDKSNPGPSKIFVSMTATNPAIRWITMMTLAMPTTTTTTTLNTNHSCEVRSWTGVTVMKSYATLRPVWFVQFIIIHWHCLSHP